MSRYSDAVFELLRDKHVREVSSKDLWHLLSAARPDLTAATANRKTPRATVMRDLRKDARFTVARGNIAIRG